MTGPSTSPRALLRAWRNAGILVRSADGAEERRARALPGIAAAIRRSARQRARRRRLRRIAGPLVAAAIVLIALGAVWRLGSDPEARVVARESSHAMLVEGAIWVGSGTDERRVESSRTTTALSSAALIRTASTKSATIDLGSRTRVEVAPATTMQLKPTHETPRMQLSTGRVEVEVDPTKSGDRVYVDTPHATVVVVGTHFSVEVAGEQTERATTVSVARGVVLVYQGEQQVARLRRGETWSSHRVRAAEERQGPSARGRGDNGAERSPPAGLAAKRVAATPAKMSSLGEANTLFQQAIDARNGGDDEAAARLFSECASRFPGSPLAQEARVEELRALERLGSTSSAAQAARRYLAEHPEGFARDEAKQLVLEGGPGSPDSASHVGRLPD